MPVGSHDVFWGGGSEDDLRMVEKGGKKEISCTKADHYLSFLSGINLNPQ